MSANGQDEAGAGQKILVVDDEPHILSSIQDLLEDNYSVLALTDARRALELLEEEEVAVILSDQRMPGLSGDQFLREAQQRSQAARVLITGYADLQALVRAVNEGKIYGYVAKPWEPEELKGLISRAAAYFRLTRELEREREYTRSIIETANDAFVGIDTSGRITDWNRQAEAVFGWSREEALGQPLAETIIPPQHREAHLEGLRRFLETGEGPLFYRRIEISALHRQGHEFPVEVTIWPVRVGRTHRFCAFVQDITRRRRTEEALHQSREELAASERRLRTIIEAEPECVKLLDLEGRVLEMNQAGLAMIEAQSLEQVAGQSVYPFVAPEHRRDFRALTEGAFAGREGQLEFEAVGLKGTRRWLDTHVVPLRDSQDRITAALGITRDVTERKRLEAQLLQAQKLEAVGRLAGGVAHDFNNLLTVISGYCELLLRRLQAADPGHAGLQEIQRAADRGSSLVRQLLAFSRKQVLEPKVLDLNAVVNGLEQMLGRLIGEDVELVFRLDPGLGQVRADPGQLEQVLVNLAVNARDAMPQGGRLLIETRNADLDPPYAANHLGAKPGAYVLLEVTDTGVGMDEETQAHVFEPFFTTKEPGQGTGLGLATVYGIVVQSEGYISVYSELGKGTSFKIFLPRLEAALEAAVQEEAPQFSRGVETVLLVEDEKPLRELTRVLLREAGYTVLEAGQGEEALQVAARHPGPLHLLVTDMVMPGMGGRELAERLSALHPDLKVLYISGYSPEVVTRQGSLEPGRLFLQKPFKAASLLLKVREALDR
jgi:PAS domain S-box-containing protein